MIRIIYIFPFMVAVNQATVIFGELEPHFLTKCGVAIMATWKMIDLCRDVTRGEA